MKENENTKIEPVFILIAKIMARLRDRKKLETLKNKGQNGSPPPVQ